MQIAIASGKGGAGKTTVATNLAAVLAERGQSVVFIDCDVEEPNGRLFLSPDIDSEVQVGVPIPQVDQTRCTFCGKCSEICRFKALVVTPHRVLHFPELCRGCGGCVMVCPEQAISETTRSIGAISRGRRGKLGVVEGRLNVGEMQTPPLIRRTKEAAEPGVVIVDSPPGTSCAAMEAVRDADYVLLVAEPTPFGVHDMAWSSTATAPAITRCEISAVDAVLTFWRPSPISGESPNCAHGGSCSSITCPNTRNGLSSSSTG